MPEKQKYEDNPIDDDFKKLKDDGRRFHVLHTGVGPHARGAVVSAKSFGPGAQMQRLIDQGAIVEVEKAEPEPEKAETPAEEGKPAESPPEAEKPKDDAGASPFGRRK